VSNPWIRLVAREVLLVGATAPYLPPHVVRRQEPSPFRLRLRGTKPGLRRAPAAVLSPLRGGLIRGTKPRRRHQDFSPVERQRSGGVRRGGGRGRERSEPGFSAFGRFPPFACGSGGQSQGCAVLRRRYFPPLRG